MGGGSFKLCELRAQRLGLSVTPDGHVPIQQLILARPLQRLRALPEGIELLTRNDGTHRFQVSIVDGVRVARAWMATTCMWW